MTDFTALLDELLIDLRQPQVRDLAWTLLSPPLLQPGSPALRHPLRASRWYSQPALLAAWLHTQERSPGELLEQLESAPHQRLGRYYERLWQYALEHAPDLRLLAANLPVRDNGQTLGELDLLLEDDDGLHHLELAIKLYLGPSDDGPNAWLGPGAEDHLLRKIEHFYQHQLPLSSTTEGLAVVRQFSRAEPAPGLWLGGYLFYSWPTPCPPPVGASDNHQRGRWLHRRAWPAYHALHPHGWQALSRKAWLSPTVEDECWSAERFATWLAELPEDGFPQMLVRLEQRHGRWREQERLFLVGDRWPRVHSGYSR